MSRYLTKLGYAKPGRSSAKWCASIRRSVPHTLCILQGFIDNQGDAWNYALDYLRRTVDELALAVDTEDHSMDREKEMQGIEIRGRLRGSLGGVSANCTSRSLRLPTTRRSRPKRHRRKTCAHGTTARTRCSSPRSISSAPIPRLQRARPRTRAKPARSPRSAARGRREAGAGRRKALRIRIHGIFHLTAFWWANGDALLLDFEVNRQCLKRRQSRTVRRGRLIAFSFVCQRSSAADDRKRTGCHRRSQTCTVRAPARMGKKVSLPNTMRRLQPHRSQLPAMKPLWPPCSISS